jgi:hypothetical protein
MSALHAPPRHLHTFIAVPLEHLDRPAHTLNHALFPPQDLERGDTELAPRRAVRSVVLQIDGRRGAVILACLNDRQMTIVSPHLRRSWSSRSTHPVHRLRSEERSLVLCHCFVTPCHETVRDSTLQRSPKRLGPAHDHLLLKVVKTQYGSTAMGQLTGPGVCWMRKNQCQYPVAYYGPQHAPDVRRFRRWLTR